MIGINLSQKNKMDARACKCVLALVAKGNNKTLLAM